MQIDRVLIFLTEIPWNKLLLQTQAQYDKELDLNTTLICAKHLSAGFTVNRFIISELMMLVMGIFRSNKCVCMGGGKTGGGGGVETLGLILFCGP